MSSNLTRPPGTPIHRAQPQALWPWSAKAAVTAAAISFLTLLCAMAVTKATAAWPAPGTESGVLLGILGLALVPVFLIVIERLSSSGGEVKVAGVSLSFAQVSAAAATTVTTTTLAENLDPDADPAVVSTGLRNILRALRRAHDSQVTIVDLGKGDRWWEDRLFILLAGAAYRGSPQAVVFIADLHGRKGAFVGWGIPSRLVERHLAAVPRAKTAYEDALRLTRLWELGVAAIPETTPPHVILPWNSERLFLPQPVDEQSDPDFAMELFLQQSMEVNLPMVPHVLAEDQKVTVSVSRLRELYESVMITDQIDAESTDEQWASLLASTDRAYFALTDQSVFKDLIPRNSLMSRLVVRIVRASQ